MEYKFLSKTKARELKSLSSKKERDRQGLFIAEGAKCVADLMASFTPEYVICTPEWVAEEPTALNPHISDKILIADHRCMEIISALPSLPRVIAVFHKKEPITGIPRLKEGKIYLLLDDIQDPGNLGTIIRTCDWFGVYDIFASRNTVDVYGNKVVQASMGSLSRVRVNYVDLEKLIEENSRFPIIGTLLEGRPLKDVEVPSEGALLLMGNEGKGISNKLKEMIDIPLTIPPVNPMAHPDSLNVAVATAVILSRLARPC